MNQFYESQFCGTVDNNMHYNYQSDPRIELSSNNHVAKHYSPQRYHNLYTSNIFQQPSPQYVMSKKSYIPKSLEPLNFSYPETSPYINPYINKHMIKNDMGWDGVKLVQYVTNTLDKQEYLKDSAILQKFRLQAEQRKKKKQHYLMQPITRYSINQRQKLSTPIQMQYIQPQKISISNPQKQYVTIVPYREKTIDPAQFSMKLVRSLKKENTRKQKIKQKYNNLKVRYKKLKHFKQELKYENKFNEMEKQLKQMQLAVLENKSLVKSRAKTQQSYEYYPENQFQHNQQFQDEYQQTFSNDSKNQFIQKYNSEALVKPLVVYSPQIAKPKNTKNNISNFLQGIKTKRKRIEYSTINS